MNYREFTPLEIMPRCSLRARSPSGAEPGPAAAAGLDFRIIPVGFNAPFKFLTGFTRRLQVLGCKEIPRRGGGSHRKWINPASGKGTVVPDWGNKDLKRGTIRGILKQLGIDIKDFEKA